MSYLLAAATFIFVVFVTLEPSALLALSYAQALSCL